MTRLKNHSYVGYPSQRILYDVTKKLKKVKRNSLAKCQIKLIIVVNVTPYQKIDRSVSVPLAKNDMFLQQRISNRGQDLNLDPLLRVLN